MYKNVVVLSFAALAFMLSGCTAGGTTPPPVNQWDDVAANPELLRVCDGATAIYMAPAGNSLISDVLAVGECAEPGTLKIDNVEGEWVQIAEMPKLIRFCDGTNAIYMAPAGNNITDDAIITKVDSEQCS